MPTTRKQRSKSRKSREAEMLSDVENLVIMFCSNHLEREESELSNSVRRPECPSYNALVNYDGNLSLIIERTRLGVMPETANTIEKLTQVVKLIGCRGN